MKNESATKTRDPADQASDLPVRKARPTGALIVGAYLIGMTGLGASAYAIRQKAVDIPAPVVATELPGSLPMPKGNAGTDISPRFAAISTRRAPTADAPRLAALTPSETRLDSDLISPLSRIYLGRPAVVPPPRPETPVEGPAPNRNEPDSDAALAPTETAAGITASLRPKLRPRALAAARARTKAADGLRLASLAAPQTLRDAKPAPNDQAADVPAVPRLTAKAGTCPGRLARGMPRRPSRAPGAKSFLASVQTVDGVKRDQQILREILNGNMPGFLRDLAPVDIVGRSRDGREVRITLCVTPDYLALGSDRDFVRVPLGLRAATRIGDRFGMILPTPRMVDAIYRAAAVRLVPQPMTPGAQMTSTAYLMRHNETINAQMRRAGVAPGVLIAGHKKDVVLSARLASNRGRVAIYGWHRTNGRPIQPLSTVHGAGYADYSHGIRLISRTAFLNGQAVDLRDLLADPRYAGLLSSEGPIGGPRLRMAALASN